jgi:hypothetical protein
MFFLLLLLPLPPRLPKTGTPPGADRAAHFEVRFCFSARVAWGDRY